MSNVFLVNSLEEYRELIANMINFGFHVPNHYAKLDDVGMSVADSFCRLDPTVAYDSLSAYVGRHPNYEEEAEEDGRTVTYTYRYCPTLPINPDEIVFDRDTDILVPTEPDFPIICRWYWEDSFDRMGDIKIREFEWWSVAKLPTPGSVRANHTLWQQRHGESYREICRLYEERKRARGR